jgi:hypothetical protein
MSVARLCWISSRSTFWRSLLAVGCFRYLILLSGFLTVVLAEAALYRFEFGSFLAKYSATISHFNDAGRAFYRDLWLYPENMFFLRRGWTFQLPPPEYRPYGFFFVAAAPSMIYGLVRGGARFGMVGVWGLATFAYLQWGTTSLSSWNLLHRLDRHLELVTPPMILAIAFVLARLMRTRLSVIAVMVLSCLFATSVWTIHNRHAETMSHLALMEPVHSVLEVFQPSRVFMDTQTGAYQRFLDRYEALGRAYEDIGTLSSEVAEDCMVVVHSDNVFPDPGGGASPLSALHSWQLLATVNVASHRGAPRSVRAYRVSPRALPRLNVDRAVDVERHLREIAPAGIPSNATLFFFWEGLVDGVDRVEIRGRTSILQPMAFQPAREVIWRSYQPIETREDWRYTVIKEAGRGDVTIVQRPSEANGRGLIVEVNDGAAPGAARYRWFIVATPSIDGVNRGSPQSETTPMNPLMTDWTRRARP